MNARDLAIIGTFTALIIGGQFALSFLSGVEIVTVMFAAFAFSFGVYRSVICANAFALLRCFVFGFYPTVLIVYLIYYNVFAVTVGLIGKSCRHTLTPKTQVLLTLIALVLNACFTALDNLVTPLFYGFDEAATKSYVLYSLAALIPQLICTLVTVSALTYPLHKALMSVKK